MDGRGARYAGPKERYRGALVVSHGPINKILMVGFLIDSVRRRQPMGKKFILPIISHLSLDARVFFSFTQ
jgi:hypothetical protein